MNVSMETKLDALKRIDNGESFNKVALDLGVGRSTILGWKKQRTEIESWCAKRMCNDTISDRKSMKGGDFEHVSEALYMWFVQHRERGTPMSGPILQKKALDFYEKMRKEDWPLFTASVGWFDRWKKRYGIRQLTVCGEKLSAKNEDVMAFKEKFHKLIEKEKLSGDQIYNCDESGLNYRMLPTKTLAAKQEKSAPGYKRSKERVTLLACSNATGDHKLELALIGKAKNPRCFKNVKKTTNEYGTVYDLPVWYRNQSNAWMDGSLFKDWFHQRFVPSVDKYLEEKKLPRKAILIMDNASSHPDVEYLCDGDIKAYFLPPNVTSLCQPMDQGVLAAVKKRYRHKLLTSLILAMDEGSDMVQKLKSIDLLDVVMWVNEAWNELDNITLVRSWRKLLDHDGNEFREVCTVPNKEESTSALLELLQRVEGCEEAGESDVQEWFEQDESGQELGDDEIAVAVLAKDDDEDEPKDKAVEDVETNKISHTEGLKSVECALRYFEQEGAAAMDILVLRRLRDTAARRRVQSEKQTKLTSFFGNKDN